jgi:hypothetical protein
MQSSEKNHQNEVRAQSDRKIDLNETKTSTTAFSIEKVEEELDEEFELIQSSIEKKLLAKSEYFQSRRVMTSRTENPAATLPQRGLLEGGLMLDHWQKRQVEKLPFLWTIVPQKCSLEEAERPTPRKPCPHL